MFNKTQIIFELIQKRAKVHQGAHSILSQGYNYIFYLVAITLSFPEFLIMLASEYNKRHKEVNIKQAFNAYELADIKNGIRFINSSKDITRI